MENPQQEHVNQDSSSNQSKNGVVVRRRMQEPDWKVIEPIVKSFRYYSQFYNKFVEDTKDYDRITFKTYYYRYQKSFDKLAHIFKKYNIDVASFMKFAVNYTHAYIPSLLLDGNLFKKYADHLEVILQYKKIRRYYMKSVKNIAETCITRGITPKDYLKELILENKLAYEVISGRISKYFISSIQNIKKIYEKLDKLNQDELCIIIKAVDELNGAVQDSFLKLEGRRVTPIREVESLINKMTQQTGTQI